MSKRGRGTTFQKNNANEISSNFKRKVQYQSGRNNNVHQENAILQIELLARG